MRNLLKILTLPLCVFTFISCEKHVSDNSISNTTIEKSKINYLPEIEGSIIINKDDKQIAEFVSLMKNSNLKIDYSTAVIHKITFKEFPSLTGIYVKGLEYGLICKDLFYVSDTQSKINLLIEREKSGFSNNNNGYISIRNYNNELLFNDQIVNNKFSYQTTINTFTQGPLVFNSKNIKTNREWICSEEKFNAFYQEAKARCEDDWLCDVACSINPCFIAYLAFAVGKCSELIK